MLNQHRNFKIGESVDVGAYPHGLALDLRMRGGRVVAALDDVAHRKEQHARGIFKGLELELPNPIHENVGRSHARANEPSRAAVASHLERRPGVAHQDAVKIAATRLQARLADHLAQRRLDNLTIEPQPIAHLRVAARRAQVTV